MRADHSCHCLRRPEHHPPSRSNRVRRRVHDKPATQHRRSPGSRETGASSGGRNRAEQHPIPIHPLGAPWSPRSIQGKMLIAISESRRPRRNSVRYRVNAGLFARSDVAGVRQIFGSREYDIGAPVQAAGLRINARHRAILDAGRKPVIVDAGANIGAAALWFRKKYPGAAVVAVEPDPGNVRALNCNLTGRHDMIVLAAAIGARSGFVEVKKEKDRLNWTSRTTRAESGVPVVTMTDAFAKV